MMIRTILFVVAAVQFSHAQTLQGQYPQASQKILSLSEIDTMAEKSLRIMRNEIFARYGFIFKSADLTQHFSKTIWYKATSADVTSKLTEVEKTNIDFIRNQEARVKAFSEFDTFYESFRNAILKDDFEKVMRLVHINRMNGEADARASIRKYWSELKEAARSNEYLTEQDGSATLTYDTRNDGTTQDFLVFQKIGSCWYIVGFDGIG